MYDQSEILCFILFYFFFYFLFRSVIENWALYHGTMHKNVLHSNSLPISMNFLFILLFSFVWSLFEFSSIVTFTYRLAYHKLLNGKMHSLLECRQTFVKKRKMGGIRETQWSLTSETTNLNIEQHSKWRGLSKSFMVRLEDPLYPITTCMCEYANHGIERWKCWKSSR